VQDVDASFFYRCPQCIGGEDVGAKGVSVFILDTADKLEELVYKFYYMRDMLLKGQGQRHEFEGGGG